MYRYRTHLVSLLLLDVILVFTSERATRDDKLHRWYRTHRVHKVHRHQPYPSKCPLQLDSESNLYQPVRPNQKTIPSPHAADLRLRALLVFTSERENDSVKKLRRYRITSIFCPFLLESKPNACTPFHNYRIHLMSCSATAVENISNPHH